MGRKLDMECLEGLSQLGEAVGRLVRYGESEPGREVSLSTKTALRPSRVVALEKRRRVLVLL